MLGMSEACACTCRLAFGHVLGRCKELIEYIAEQGPSAVLDVDDLLLREAMDVIGKTFKNFRAVIHELKSCRVLPSCNILPEGLHSEAVPANF